MNEIKSNLFFFLLIRLSTLGCKAHTNQVIVVYPHRNSIEGKKEYVVGLFFCSCVYLIRTEQTL